jgi:hypothetical protein
MTKTFAQFANWVAVMSGHPAVFGFAILTVVAWMVTGPFFYFSDTWQLVMNTWTNVATFLDRVRGWDWRRRGARRSHKFAEFAVFRGAPNLTREQANVLSSGINGTPSRLILLILRIFDHRCAWRRMDALMARCSLEAEPDPGCGTPSR